MTRDFTFSPVSFSSVYNDAGEMSCNLRQCCVLSVEKFQTSLSLLALLSSLVEVRAQEDRQIQLQNISLVITYTGMVVAVLMMAGFLYVALNFGKRRSGYGYNYDQDYYDDYSYSRRYPGNLAICRHLPKSFVFIDNSVLSNLLHHLNKYGEEEE